MHKNRNARGRPEIFEDILEASNEGIMKTHLMHRCNLSLRQVNWYLEELQANDLVKSFNHEDRVNYIITERGRHFLDSLRIVTKLMNTGSM